VAQPTLRQIAAACGVNHSTVSRALNDSSRIPSATRDRIVEIARRMGWQPNPLASAYMAHLRSTHPPSFKATLGFLIDVPNLKDLNSLPGHVQFHLDGARARAATYGYTIHVANLGEPGMTPRLADQAFRNRNVPGIIISSLDTKARLRHIAWRRYAAVMLGSPIAYPDLHRVQSATHRGFLMTINRAFELGYERVAVVVSEAYDRQTDHGVLFPVAYARDRLRPGRSLNVLAVSPADEHNRDRVCDWLREIKPDLIIGTDLAMAAVMELGWQVPRDIAFASVDRSPGFPHMAGFDQRHDLFGAVGIDLLVSQINSNERDIPANPILHLIHGRWADGASVPPRN